MNLKITEAQKHLYHVAENMKMQKKISDEGYEHFQMAIKALAKEEQQESVHEASYLAKWAMPLVIFQIFCAVIVS